MTARRPDLEPRRDRAIGMGNGLLIVANWPSDVGYAWWFMERIWLALAANQQSAGGWTHIVYPGLTSVSAAVTAAPVSPHDLDFSDRSGASRRRLCELVRREGIRAVYLTDRPSLDPWYGLLRSWGVRAIVNNDQTPGDRQTAPLRRLVKSAAHRLSWFSPDLSVAPSQFVFDRFDRVYGLPSSRCLLIPNGIEPIDVDAADRGYVRREFALPAEATVVVSLSRAVEYKGIGLIIDCADRLINGEGRHDLYFVHCGDGPDLESFQDRVRELGLERRFLLPGARPDYRKILPSSDVAFHASQGEGFSLAVLECMSAALPLIVPDNSGNREAVEHGQSGLLYEPGEIEAALSSLRSLLDDAARRRRLGAAARAVVLERFTLEMTLQRFVREVGPFLTGRVARAA